MRPTHSRLMTLLIQKTKTEFKCLTLTLILTEWPDCSEIKCLLSGNIQEPLTDVMEALFREVTATDKHKVRGVMDPSPLTPLHSLWIWVLAFPVSFFFVQRRRELWKAESVVSWRCLLVIKFLWMADVSMCEVFFFFTTFISTSYCIIYTAV